MLRQKLQGKEWHRASSCVLVSFLLLLMIVPHDLANASTSSSTLQRANDEYAKIHGFLSSGNYEEAEHILNNVIAMLGSDHEHDPKVADVRSKHLATLGSVMMHLGKTEEARERAEQAISAHPNSFHLHYLLGTVHQNQGHFEMSREYYEKALELGPNEDIVEMKNKIYTRLGNVYRNLGEYVKSVKYHKSAIKISPKSKLYISYYNLGNSLRDANHFESAIKTYKKALQYRPDHTQSMENLALLLDKTGNKAAANEVLKKLGKDVGSGDGSFTLSSDDGSAPLGALGSGADDTRQSRDLQFEAATLPEQTHARSLHGKAVQLYQRGGSDNIAQALPLLAKAISYYPNSDIICDYGVMLFETGSDRQAISLFDEALARDPKHGYCHNNLGSLYKRSAHYQGAIKHLREAIECGNGPEEHRIRSTLGDALIQSGDITEGLVEVERAIAINQKFPVAYKVKALGLLEQGESAKAILALESRRKNTGIIDSNYCNTYLYNDENSVQVVAKKHADVCGLWESAHGPLNGVRSRGSLTKIAQSNERNLKIGYITPDLHAAHPTMQFMMGLLTHHHHTFDVIVYNTNTVARSDNHSRVVQTFNRKDSVDYNPHYYTPEWKNVEVMDARQLAIAARDDGVDILVHLLGHQKNNKLKVMAQHPTPITVEFLGYSFTTGMSTIDYVLLDNELSPPSDTYFTETPVRFHNHSLFNFWPAPGIPEPALEPPVVKNGIITFGSYNVLRKVTPSAMSLWVEILQRVPNSRIILKGKTFNDARSREVMLQRFVDAGLDPYIYPIPDDVTITDELSRAVDEQGRLRRVVLLEATSPMQRFLFAYHDLDIALDPIPFQGGTTTCQALYMGVPVVTLVGDRYQHRMGYSILAALDAHELVAHTREKYVNIVADLAADRERLRRYRRTLRPRMEQSSLMDYEGFAYDIEDQFRRMALQEV